MLVGVAVLALAFFVLPDARPRALPVPARRRRARSSPRSRCAGGSPMSLSGAAMFANMYVVLTTWYPTNPNIHDWLGIGPTLASFWGVAIASLTQAAVLGWAFVQLRAGGDRGAGGGRGASSEPAATLPTRPLARSDGSRAGPATTMRVTWPKARVRTAPSTSRARRRPGGMLRAGRPSRRARPGSPAAAPPGAGAGTVSRSGTTRARRGLGPWAGSGRASRDTPLRADRSRDARARARRPPRQARPVDARRARDQPPDRPHVAARRALPDALRRGLPPAHRDGVPAGLALRADPRDLRMDPPAHGQVRDGRRDHGLRRGPGRRDEPARGGRRRRRHRAAPGRRPRRSGRSRATGCGSPRAARCAPTTSRRASSSGRSRCPARSRSPTTSPGSSCSSARATARSASSTYEAARRGPAHRCPSRSTRTRSCASAARSRSSTRRGTAGGSRRCSRRRARARGPRPARSCVIDTDAATELGRSRLRGVTQLTEGTARPDPGRRRRRASRSSTRHGQGLARRSTSAGRSTASWRSTTSRTTRSTHRCMTPDGPRSRSSSPPAARTRGSIGRTRCPGDRRPGVLRPGRRGWSTSRARSRSGHEGAGADTVYVIEPHGNAVYADARAAVHPVGDRHGRQPAVPIDAIASSCSRSTRAAQVASVEIGRHAFAWRVPGRDRRASSWAC